MKTMHQQPPQQQAHKNTPQEVTHLFKDVIQLSKTKSQNIKNVEEIDENIVINMNSESKATSKILIEEISEVESSMIKTPLHKERVVEREGGRFVEVRVWLPGVECLEKCSLQVSEVCTIA